MENEKIKSRPGKIMENENLAKSHEKGMNFDFSQISVISFKKNVLMTYNDTDSPPSCKVFYM